MQNASASSSTSNGPRHLIAADKAKPANCFAVNGSASVGFKLALNHPAVPQNLPALMLSERRYVGRHRVSPKGCLYEAVEGAGVVRRARLDEIPLSSGRSIPVLARLDVEKLDYLLVHVLFGQADGVKLRGGMVPLYSGVRGATLVSDASAEALMRVKEGESLKIFYPHGQVGTINYAGILAGEKVAILDVEASLAERINLAEDMFLDGDDVDEARKAESHDRAIRELVYMHKMAALYPALRGKIVAGMERLANRRPLADNMRKYVAGALKAAGDVVHYGWLLGDEDVATLPQAAVNGNAGSTITRGQLKRLIYEQHQLLDQAVKGFLSWESVLASFRLSAQGGELGFSAQKRFCVNCPVGSGMSEEVGNLPLAALEKEKKTSPLGQNRKALTPQEKLKAKSDRDTRRAERNKPENRPVGKQGTKENPGDAARKRREAEEALRKSKK